MIRVRIRKEYIRVRVKNKITVKGKDMGEGKSGMKEMCGGGDAGRQERNVFIGGSGAGPGMERVKAGN